jgi:hypothetical protein
MNSASTLRPAFRLHGESHPPGWSDQLIARLRSRSIDGELASGIASWQSPAHAARSLQLTTRRKRDSLAAGLEHLIELAEDPALRYGRTRVIQPSRGQVRDAKPVIRAVAARMRDREPVDARAAAALRLLLTDGAGPCYGPAQRWALSAALETVTRWL